MPTSRRLFQDGGEGVRREVEGVLHGFEDLGAAGVEDVAGDVVEGEAVVGEEGFDVAAEVLVDDLGDVGGEDNLEAHVADAPTHDVLGVAVEGERVSRTRGPEQGQVF